jgi:hypothetical protein
VRSRTHHQTVKHSRTGSQCHVGPAAHSLSFCLGMVWTTILQSCMNVSRCLLVVRPRVASLTALYRLRYCLLRGFECRCCRVVLVGLEPRQASAVSIVEGWTIFSIERAQRWETKLHSTKADGVPTSLGQARCLARVREHLFKERTSVLQGLSWR